jgi:hypothetical protein
MWVMVALDKSTPWRRAFCNEAPLEIGVCQLGALEVSIFQVGALERRITPGDPLVLKSSHFGPERVSAEVYPT